MLTKRLRDGRTLRNAIASAVLCVAIVLSAGFVRGAETVYRGVGLVLRWPATNASPEIAHVIKNSPAALAGLSNKMSVVAVDGIRTRGKSPADCVWLIRGPTGEKVVLDVSDPSRTRTNRVTLPRALIFESKRGP